MSFRENRNLDQRNTKFKLEAARQELAGMEALHDTREASSNKPAEQAEATWQERQWQEGPAAGGVVEPPVEPPAAAAADAGAVAALPAPPTAAAPAAGGPTLPAIVQATLAAASAQDFFEKTMRGEEATLHSVDVRRELEALQARELSQWLGSDRSHRAKIHAAGADDTERRRGMVL